MHTQNPTKSYESTPAAPAAVPLGSRGKMVRRVVFSLLASLTLASVSNAATISTSDEGRLRLSDSTYIGNAAGRSIRGGDNASNIVFEGFIIFDTSSVISSNVTATLIFGIGEVLGAPGDLEVYGVSSSVGFDSVADTQTEIDAVIADGGILLHTLSSPGTGIQNLDVSSFIDSERNGGNDVVGFLYKATSIVANSTQDVYTIYDSNDTEVENFTTEPLLELTVIPEPSTAILAGLGLMGVCFRRRRK